MVVNAKRAISPRWSQLSMSACRRLCVVAAAILAPAVCAAASKPDIENDKTTFNTMCGVRHSVREAGDLHRGPIF
jgi:hypothetical protein